jgi:hypothetical protein
MSNSLGRSWSAVLDFVASTVNREMKELFVVEVRGDAVRVTTQCMYPSNGLVRVTIRGGADTIVATDEGETLGEVMSAGIVLRDPDRTLGTMVRGLGLNIEKGVIHTPRMPLTSAPIAIIMVANTAKEVAQWLYDHHKIKRDRDFRKLLSDYLKKTFDDRVTAARIVGASNKPHKFPNVISFANGHRLIIDPVANDPASINARVVANMDVASMKNPQIDQRIVYDDEESWSAADLNLLQVGAPAVAFSKSQEVIQRVAGRSQALAAR